MQRKLVLWMYCGHWILLWLTDRLKPMKILQTLLELMQLRSQKSKNSVKSDIYIINSNELKGDYDDPTTINTFCDEDMYEMKDVWPVSTPRLDQDQMVSFPQ